MTPLAHRRKKKDSRSFWSRGKVKPERRRTYGEVYAIGYIAGEAYRQYMTGENPKTEEEFAEIMTVVMGAAGLRMPTAPELESWSDRLQRCQDRYEKMQSEAEQIISSG